MDCGRFRTLYSDFTDGQLDELTEVGCHRHLAECEACRRLHAAYRAGCAVLRREPRIAPSPDFASRLDARLAGGSERALPTLRPWAMLAAAVSVVAIITATGWTMVETWPEAPLGVAAAGPGTRANPFIVRFAGDTSLDYRGSFPVIPVSRARALAQPAQFEVTVDWMEP